MKSMNDVIFRKIIYREKLHSTVYLMTYLYVMEKNNFVLKIQLSIKMRKYIYTFLILLYYIINIPNNSKHYNFSNILKIILLSKILLF